MRQISNTIKFISFYSSYLKKKESSEDINLFCHANKIKISKKLLRNIVLCKYENCMNDLIRDLSKEIKKKHNLLPIYTMVDEIYQSRRKKRNKKRIKNEVQSLLSKLEKNYPKKFIKLNQCFLDEATIRGLDTNIENYHDWCHVTNKKLKVTQKIMTMTTAHFNILISEILRDITMINNKNTFTETKEIIKSYQLLELELGSNHKKIRQQYLKLTKKNHPDIGGSVVKMASINEAYNILMSIEKNILKFL